MSSNPTYKFSIIDDQQLSISKYKLDDPKKDWDSALDGLNKWVRRLVVKSEEHGLLIFLIRSDVSPEQLSSVINEEKREFYVPMSWFMATGGGFTVHKMGAFINGGWLKPAYFVQ